METDKRVMINAFYPRRYDRVDNSNDARYVALDGSANSFKQPLPSGKFQNDATLDPPRARQLPDLSVHPPFELLALSLSPFASTDCFIDPFSVSDCRARVKAGLGRRGAVCRSVFISSALFAGRLPNTNATYAGRSEKGGDDEGLSSLLDLPSCTGRNDTNASLSARRFRRLAAPAVASSQQLAPTSPHAVHPWACLFQGASEGSERREL